MPSTINSLTYPSEAYSPIDDLWYYFKIFIFIIGKPVFPQFFYAIPVLFLNDIINSNFQWQDMYHDIIDTCKM